MQLCFYNLNLPNVLFADVFYAEIQFFIHNLYNVKYMEGGSTTFQRGNVADYKYTCPDCFFGYIGETRRHVGSRIAEHTGVSFATKKPIVGDKNSAIQRHIASTNHSTESDQFKVLCRAKSRFDLLIKESLYIARDLPALNNNVSSYPLNLFNFVFFNPPFFIIYSQF